MKRLHWTCVALFLCYTVYVANLTLSIEDRLLKEARNLALEQDTCVNQLVREFLENMVASHSRKEEAKRFLLSARFDYRGGHFNREDLYER